MKATMSQLEAVSFSLAGFTFWVLADSTIKLAGESHLPAYEIVAFLGSFMAVFLLIYGLGRNQVRALWPRQPQRQFWRSCLDLGTNLFVVIALRHMPLALFYFQHGLVARHDADGEVRQHDLLFRPHHGNYRLSSNALAR